MTTYQHEAWEANEMELDAIDAAAEVAPENDAEWQAFLDEQAQREIDAMYADPKFWDYVERAWDHVQAA
jgi:hypothetical protein